MKKLKYLFLLSISLLLSSVSSAASTLPELGDPSAATLSPADEYRLGQQVMVTIRHAMPLSHDTWALHYVKELGDRLSSVSMDSRFPYTFFIVDDKAINAFALPGGFIGVNTGLALTSDSEGELVSVMAHEMAHVSQRHIARMFVHQRQVNLTTLAGALAAVVIATQNPQAGSGALMATIAGQAQSFLNFTRSNEQEADRVGIQTMYDAKYDPNQMVSFFEKLYQSKRFSNQYLPEYLQTHPLTQSRIADAKSRADQLTQASPLETSKAYHFVKARLRHQQFTMPKDSLSYFSAPLESSDDNQLAAHQYGYALALNSAGQYEQARQELQKLQQSDAGNLFLLSSLADTEVLSGNLAKAIQDLASAIEQYPSHLPLIQQLSDVYLYEGKPAQAINLIEEYHLHYGETADTLQLLSRAYGQSSNMVAMHFYQAKYLEFLGEYHEALSQLKIANRQPEPPARMLLQIEAKISEIQTIIDHDKKPL